MSQTLKKLRYKIIAEKFRILDIIGCGSFGIVYLAINIQTNEEVAIKMEAKDAPLPQLKHEINILKILNGSLGIPKLHYDFELENAYGMVIDSLGPSLEDLFQYCSKHFSLKTIIMLADQMIARLEVLHYKGYIHRDLKPDNFLMGKQCNEYHKLYLIDFGLAKEFYNWQTRKHISYKNERDLSGTARFASVNGHLGIEQSRRDDMEILGYVLIYLHNGILPWQGIKACNRYQMLENISQRKLSITLEKLCKDLPDEFFIYMKYCRTMSFQQQPNYLHLRKLFRTLFYRRDYHFDFFYDWNIIRLKGKTQRQNDVNDDDDQQKKSRRKKTAKNICSLRMR